MSRDLRELLKAMNALPVLKVSGEAMHEAFADMDGITGADQFFVDWDEQEWFVPLSSVVAAIEALLADTPSVEPRETDFDLLLRRAYANGHRDGLECSGPLAASECDHVGSARLLPTQASDSPEKP